MRSLVAVVIAAALVACAEGDPAPDSSAARAAPAQPDSARPLATRGGFTEPEAVRYDPDQDVYFVGNWGGGATDAKDNNGFISKLQPDGTLAELRFIAGGTGGVTLHAPRGMTIVGDTLWVVDADAVRGFNRKTGAPLATVSFAAFQLGFLNDIAAASDALYVTDTGTDHIYRISGGKVTVALKDSALGSPNGITRDPGADRFIVVPYGGDSVIKAWTPGSRTLTVVGRGTGTKLDGVEILSGDRIIVAAQGDSSIHLFSGGTGRPIIHTGGAPADIAVDTKRNHVAIPFVDRNLVEIWQLPPQS